MKKIGQVIGVVLVLMFSSFPLTTAWAGEDIAALRAKAEAGDANAQTRLGVLYETGDGVPKDYGKAAHWYRLAANQGVAEAQASLGFLYDEGWGVQQDYGKAAHWYRLAANQGNDHAELYLGTLYYYGRGVPQNYARAYKWWILAKAAGNKYASKDLDLLMPQMTKEQIAEGQRLAEEWMAMKNGSAPSAKARTNPFP